MTRRVPIANSAFPLVFVLIAVAITLWADPSEKVRADGDPARGAVIHNITQDTFHATIQDAISAAVGGDEIEVGPGTYVEQIDLLGKAITLRSTDGPQATIIDGNGTGPVVTCDSDEGSDTVLEGFTITGGQAVNGGGMFILQAAPTVENCTFSHNQASVPAAVLRGGGLFVFQGDPHITGCTFVGNTASAPTAVDAFGGGMYLDQSSASVINCTFVDNAVTVNTPAPIINAWGGGIYAIGGTPMVFNGRFSGNSVSATTAPGLTPHARGGGIAGAGADLTVTNCTFRGNSAATSPLPNGLGGGVYTAGGVSTIANCVFFANTASLPPMDVSGTVSVTHSCLQLPTAGAGNIAADPLLIDDDLHLHEDSPCINAGNDHALPGDILTDFEGDDRIRQCRVDMGADETPHIGFDCNGNGVADACDPGIAYIDDDAAPLGDGRSWAAASDDLQAVLLSLDCAVHEIRVAGGTYRPGNARTDSFQLRNNVSLLGGYRGLEGGGDPNQRGFESILSGDIGVIGAASDNSYHVVSGNGVDASAVIDGFTITEGTADGSDPDGSGAGMYIENGSPTVTNCAFTDNAASEDGGGLFSYLGSPSLNGCTFIGNNAGFVGGGISTASSGATVNRCTFIGNTSGDCGGGIDNFESTPVVSRCTFGGNSSGSGGAMCDYDSAPVVTDCAVSGNHADTEGGGMFFEVSDGAIVTNCTFGGNTAGTDGGAILTRRGGTVVSNCVSWGNSAPTNPEIGDGFEGSTIAMFSCIQDADANDGSVYPGLGNIDDDPLFVDAVGPDSVAGTIDDDLHLQFGSPGIDSGWIAAAELPAVDLDGHARSLCGTPDMGAYEFGISDIDCDGDTDLADLVNWDDCMTGPANGPYLIGCQAFDFEYDQDVDLQDFARFQVLFGGGL